MGVDVKCEVTSHYIQWVLVEFNKNHEFPDKDGFLQWGRFMGGGWDGKSTFKYSF